MGLLQPKEEASIDSMFIGLIKFVLIILSIIGLVCFGISKLSSSDSLKKELSETKALVEEKDKTIEYLKYRLRGGI